MKEKKVKRNMYDSVFNDLFSSPERLLELYKTLIGDKANPNIKAEDISIIESDKAFINDLYNDLSFMVDNELMILVEAQSTYSKNIVTRILFYLAKSLEEYIKRESKSMNLSPLYHEKVLEIPKIKLYTVYTGSKEIDDHYINLSDLMGDNNIESDVEVRVRVICMEDENNILGQYITFCKILKEQIRLNIDKEKAIKNTISICINKGILEEYLRSRKMEVSEMLAHSTTTEDWLEYIRDEILEEGIEIGEKRGKAEGISIGEKRGISIGEIKGMLLLGADHDKIIELTGASEEDILSVEKSMK